MVLSNDKKRLLWSPLSHLYVVAGQCTTNPSTSSFILVEQQLHDWPNFQAEVRTAVQPITGNPVPGFLRVQSAPETHGVGNEIGLVSRYIQHISQEMNTIYRDLNLRIRIADYQHGNSPDQPAAGAPTTYPDLIIARDDFTISVVGEVKTYWTFDRDGRSQFRRRFLANKFGKSNVLFLLCSKILLISRANCMVYV